MSIVFDSVSKKYGQVQALDEVSFSLHPGDVLGYIGPNGAGKSTTMRILCGLVKGYSGQVLVDSQNIEQSRADLHRRIGFVPQDAGFQEWRTVRHALRTFGQLSGLRGAVLEKRIEDVSLRLDLAEVAKRRILTLSGGMRQRLRFAQALLHDPAILILDEPLNGLDPASRFQFRQLIRELSGDGRIIIFSSHILNEMEDLANRIAILHQGKLRRIGTPDELRAEYGLGLVVEIESRQSAELRADWFSAVPLERLELPAVPAAKASAAEVGSPGGNPVRSPDGGTQVARLYLKPGTDAETSMPAIMKALAAHDIGLRSLRHVVPSLEDMYLALTGGEAV